jgi:long-chain acyl-CoA synthetase
MLLVLPLFHVYGMVVSTLLGCWNGTQQIFLPKYTIDSFVDAIERLRPTYIPGVPTLFTALINHPRAAACGLEKVRGFNSGAAPLPLELIQQFERLSGAPLREGYGLTEVSCTASTTPMLGRRKPGSVGLPVSSTYMRVVDLDTGEKEVPVGEEGEICIRGPQVMKGYWNNPSETAGALRNGWLYTGDIGRMDEEGFFYIVQRKKDMINVGGLKVFPTEVDEVLYQHPAVMEAAAIGVPDDYRGEVVKAFVVLKEGASARPEELIEFCRTRLAKFKVPAQIEFLDALPKSAVGKILRRALREKP